MTTTFVTQLSPAVAAVAARRRSMPRRDLTPARLLVSRAPKHLQPRSSRRSGHAVRAMIEGGGGTGGGGDDGNGNGDGSLLAKLNPFKAVRRAQEKAEVRRRGGGGLTNFFLVVVWSWYILPCKVIQGSYTSIRERRVVNPTSDTLNPKP